MAEKVIENRKQLRKFIQSLNLGLLGEEEDKLVTEMFETLCYTGTKAYENGYKQGQFDAKMNKLNGGLRVNPQDLTSICLKCGIELGNCICA